MRLSVDAWSFTEIARRVGPGGQSVAALAAEFGVSWHTAMDAVTDHARARASKQAVVAWLASKPGVWKNRIAHVVIDPHQPYAAAVRAQLPKAKLVVDDDPLYRIRRRLLCAHENLSPEGFDRVLAWLDRGDPEGEVAAAYMAKELLRRVHESDDPMAARRRLVEFYEHVADADAEIEELTTLATTIDRWEPELLRWHLTRLSNGVVEGTNLLVKNTKRSGFGFRNFHNYRHRILLRSGQRWKTPAAPSLHPAPTAVA